MKDKKRPGLEQVAAMPNALRDLEVCQIVWEAESLGAEDVAVEAEKLLELHEIQPEEIVSLHKRLQEYAIMPQENAPATLQMSERLAINQS